MGLTKTIGELIDELSIVNIKIFMEMEKEVGDLQKVKSLNRRRVDLKNALNDFFGMGESEIKTYA